MSTSPLTGCTARASPSIPKLTRSQASCTIAGMTRAAGITAALQDFALGIADPLDRVRALLQVRDTFGAQVEELARTAVDEGRAAGLTWDDIGSAFGVTRQAAQQRWGAGASDHSRRTAQPAN